jgi:hypothetical protein
MYCSFAILTRPVLATNNRGESQGNMTTLQTMTAGGLKHSVLRGASLKYAIRDNMQEMGATMWRKTHADLMGGGPTYGAEDAVRMNDVVVTPEDLWTFDDLPLFGFMIAGKGSSTSASKSRHLVSLSDALSVVPYRTGEEGLGLGVKPDGDLALYNYQQHYTRYYITGRINLHPELLANRPGALNYFIEALLAGLEVGGNHACHFASVQPEMVMWYFHQMKGASSLFIPAEETRRWDEKDEPLTFPIQRYLKPRVNGDLISYEIEGGSISDCTDQFKAAVKAHS